MTGSVSPKKETFELHLAFAEQIVQELESGQLGLEDSIAKYEQGVKALKRCYEILSQAEQKVQTLLETDSGKLQAQPFDAERSKATEAAAEDRAPAPKKVSAAAKGKTQAKGSDFDEDLRKPPF